MRRLLSRAPILLAGVMISCPDEDDECTCLPAVQSVSISPSRFQVQPGSSFELRARLIDGDGGEIPEFLYVPHWTITAPSVIVVQRSGHSVILEVPTEFDAASYPVFDVTVEAGHPAIASSPAKAVLATTSTIDHLVSDRLGGEPLSIALARDGGASSWNTPVAYSGLAGLGDFRTPNGAVMVFSTDHAMATFDNVAWSHGVDFVKNSPGAEAAALAQQDPTGPLKIDVRFWIDLSAGDDQWIATTAEAMMQLHLADANRIFLRNRVGAEFKRSDIYRISSGAPPISCDAWTVQGTSLINGSPGTFASTGNRYKVDVFVIGMETETGKMCEERDADPGYRIFLNANYALPNVLGHELGHALLTPTDIDADHLNASAMGPRNLMTQGDDDRGGVRRSHLSLGQACAMNRSPSVGALRFSPLHLPCPSIAWDVP